MFFWSFPSGFFGGQVLVSLDAAGQSFPMESNAVISLIFYKKFPKFFLFSPPSFFSAAEQWAEEWKGKLKPKKMKEKVKQKGEGKKKKKLKK